MRRDKSFEKFVLPPNSAEKEAKGFYLLRYR